jgi:hypothetical protein
LGVAVDWFSVSTVVDQQCHPSRCAQPTKGAVVVVVAAVCSIVVADIIIYMFNFNVAAVVVFVGIDTVVAV